MDKLRALQYFVASARTGSFSGAARELEVSVPAVARLVGALEKQLQLSLFERTVQGLKLTADGVRYYESCKPLLEGLAAMDEALVGAAMRPKGALVLGAPPILSQHCILPALPAFHARFPDIQVDVRTVDRPQAPEADAADVLVLYGWPQQPGMVQRRLAKTRLLICASPAYWASQGVPQRPKDLERHPCLLFRDQEGTVLDLWEHERHGEKEVAAVSGWLVSSHRDVILDAAIAGLGVARFTDLTVRTPLASGQLVPVLLDWESKHAPPINLLYRAHQRRLPRVRAFIEFLVELFARLEAERTPSMAVNVEAERPHWYRRRHGRASATPRDGR